MISSSSIRGAAVSAVAGFAIGVLTSFGQGFLPGTLSSVANSAGSWSLAAFGLALALADRRPARGAVIGAIALAAMLAGYVAASAVRGIPSSAFTILFWTAAAVVVGPVVGVGGAWVRSGEPRRAAVGIAPIAGILIGEGVYGLTTIADTTSSVYWTISLVVGAALVLASAGRLRAPRWIALAAVATVVVAVAFYAVYRLDPRTLL